MATLPVTTEQLQKIKEKIGKLSDDKDVADNATSESSAAHIALQQAQTDVTVKDQEEADADDVVSTDLADLVAYVDSLAGPAMPLTK